MKRAFWFLMLSCSETSSEETYPGPSTEVVSISIEPLHGEGCLAAKVKLLDDFGHYHFAPKNSCSSFVLMLPKDRELLGVEVYTGRPFKLEVGVDR